MNGVDLDFYLAIGLLLESRSGELQYAAVDLEERECE